MWPMDMQEAQRPLIRGLQTAPETWGQGVSHQAAAVLVLFIPGSHPEAPVNLVFTKRSTKVRTHKGQVGFPGGRREHRDQSPIATALREAQEEIALNPDWVTILGSLPSVKSLELRPVLPIVACAQVHVDQLQPSQDEVAQIFSVPWTCFTPQDIRVMKFNMFGLWRETAVYPAQGYDIWGLTAKILTLAKFSNPP